MNTNAQGDSGESRRQRIHSLHAQREDRKEFFARVRGDQRELPPSPTVRPADHTYPSEPEVIVPEAAEGRRSGWVVFVVMALGFSLLTAGSGFFLGRHSAPATEDWQIAALRQHTAQKLTVEGAARLRQALADLRSGEPEAALSTLRALQKEFPQTASLAYLAAIAAMQSGHDATAEKLAKESLKQGERISDSLALLSVLERKKARDDASRQRAEELLRAAITVDVANPNPRIELADVLRRAGRTDDAVAELDTARTLLNPVDSQLAVEITQALMKVEQAPAESLAAGAPVRDDASDLFAAAYAALRRDDPAEAARLLQRCRSLLPADIFHYLLDDPAMRKFAGRSELKNLYAP